MKNPKALAVAILSSIVLISVPAIIIAQFVDMNWLREILTLLMIFGTLAFSLFAVGSVIAVIDGLTQCHHHIFNGKNRPNLNMIKTFFPISLGFVLFFGFIQVIHLMVFGVPVFQESDFQNSWPEVSNSVIPVSVIIAGMLKTSIYFFGSLNAEDMDEMNAPKGPDPFFETEFKVEEPATLVKII